MSAPVAAWPATGDFLVDGLRPGQVLPDLALVDSEARPRLLSDVQGDDAMVLTIIRGEFCPKDHQHLADLVPFAARAGVGFCRIATVSVDRPSTMAALKQKLGASWTFLSDLDRRLQRDLGIAEYTDPHPERSSMVPHTVVLAPGLKVHAAWCGYWLWGRPTPDELWRSLRSMYRQRPDFNPTHPEARERHRNGDRDLFHPYACGVPPVLRGELT